MNKMNPQIESEPMQKTTSTPGPAYFSVQDVHAYYGESYIVQGVSFDVSVLLSGLTHSFYQALVLHTFYHNRCWTRVCLA